MRPPSLVQLLHSSKWVEARLQIHPILAFPPHTLRTTLSTTLSLMAHKQAKPKAQIRRVGRVALVAPLGSGLHLMMG